MAQFDLFEKPKKEPAPRQPSIPFIRKELNRILLIMKRAHYMPWPDHEMDVWIKRFPSMSQHLPDGEGAELLEAFEQEIARLGKAA